ncbi:hypothetical protein [Paenibacillus sp. LHD-38]|uniref:hypothetical protein n=1 Tax=Paenibacillus sp. LHD-38 TaxID=3072143 RepID=UPI00280F17A0|nr:hypothetical protein [Paenibacillus sp. LHD-38]MDQ8737156.1 hypothetical protein [Paenibacillus sp. LHD-38]
MFVYMHGYRKLFELAAQIKPSERQLAIQKMEEDNGWGMGDEDSSIFNPVELDANQWVSDILPLRVCEVKAAAHLKVREKKTGNTRRILITEALKNEVQKYCRTLGDKYD